MIAPMHYGKVVNKKLILDNEKRMAEHIVKLDGQEVEVSLRKRKSKRSEAQNKYIWGCVYQLISEHTGEDKNRIHEWCKAEFLDPEFITIKEKVHKVIPSTTALSTKGMTEYIEKIRRWAGETLEVFIPAPGEPMDYDLS